MRVSALDIDRVYTDQMTRPQDYGVSANHFHCYYELFYVRQGKCKFFVNNRFVDVGVGEILIIPPREVHNNKYITATVRNVIYFRKNDVMENGEYAIPDFNAHFKQMQMIHIPSTYRPVVEGLFDAMLREESINDDNTAHMLQLLLKQLLLCCNRYCTFRPNPLSVSSNGNEDMLKATHYIADHYQQPITLDEVAEEVNLSPSYLSKKFHNTIGKTISEYLNSERLKHAALELISTKHSITEIALNSGFNDANYFKDVFKKTFGISPREYRKRREAVYQTDTKIVTAKEDDLIKSEGEVS